MRSVQRQFYDEIHPESHEDVERLKRTYPHLCAFEYVCVMRKQKPLTPVEMRDMYLPRQQRNGRT